MKMKKRLKGMMKSTLWVLLFLVLVQVVMLGWTQLYILKSDDFEAETILVLGALVRQGNIPSVILQDRLDAGLTLYEKGLAPSFILTGDHGHEDYDEVNTMYAYMTEKGLSADILYLDHAGFSTYESIVRAKKVFHVKKMIIVTQGYHLPRAIMIARFYGIDAYGYPSDLHFYPKMVYYELREIAARYKDMFQCLIQAPPRFLGPSIPILMGAEASHDKK